MTVKLHLFDMGKNIAGNKFNLLTAIKFIDRDKNGRAKWLFKCKCGKEKVLLKKQITSLSIKSCGCLAKPDITGQKFGKLTAIKFYSNTAHHAKWLFKCDCGGKVIAYKAGVISGNTKSCGCLHAESVVKHRLSNTPVYNIWDSMIQRCTNKKNIGYKRYGKRGIKVCDRWLNSFQNFLDDMGQRPGGTSLDRIDNNGNYEPSNCRWATIKEQATNKRNNKKFEINGAVKCLSDWCREYNIGVTTVGMRIKSGWDPIRAITTKVGEVGRWKK